MNKDVFISYSTKNENIANLVVNTLESQGMSCWIAPRDIPAGKDYAQCILEAIADSKVMVVVFSAQSNISVFVQREIERAIHYNSTIIPFKIENIFPTESMEFYLSTVQWLDAWQPPKEKYLNILSDRVKQLLLDPEVKSSKAKSSTISTKQRKAFDLAYNKEKRKEKNVPHAAFWLGSRYLPGFDLYEITRKQNLQERQMLDKALFSEFEKYEQQLGLNKGFWLFFKSLADESDPKKKHAIRQAFIHKMIDSIGDNHGPREASIWMLGILLSTLWLWMKRGKSGVVNDVIKIKIDETCTSISTTLLSIDMPPKVKDDFKEIHRDFQKSKNIKILQDRITNWTAQIEMYLLIGELEINPENAEVLFEINPQLATYVLQEYLKKSPDDGEALILLGKASLKIMSDDLSLEPLFRTDPEKNLTWSMNRSIQLNPGSEWSNRAQFILDKINSNIN